MTTYKYTKQDMEAATRLQIWQEIMRHLPPYDPIRQGSQATVNPEGAADMAVRIFDKLHGVVVAKRK